MNFKKIGQWICLVASILVIGSSVSGWISEKDTDKDTGNGVTVEQSIDE